MANLYATDTDPVVAARSLDDRRMEASIPWIARSLSTALGGNRAMIGLYEMGEITPVIQWMASSGDRFHWAATYGCELTRIYVDIHGSNHPSERVIRLALGAHRRVEGRGLEPFINRACDTRRWADKTAVEDPIEAYREHLIACWRRETVTPSWLYRGPPAWFVEV